MTDPTTIGSLKAIFRFPFSGAEWRNRFLIGCLLVLGSFVIPILPGLLVAGYALRIMRQAVDGEEIHLPAWGDWGKLAVDGFRWSVISFVYLLPGIIVVTIGYAAYIGGFVAGIAQDAGRGSDTGGLMMLTGMAVMFIAMAVGMLLLVLAAIPLPTATAHFVKHDKISAAFRVSEWWPLLKANKLGYFVAWVVIAGLYSVWTTGLVVLMYSVILCCLALFAMGPMSMYLSAVTAALFGQVYRESSEMSAQSTLAKSELAQADLVETESASPPASGPEAGPAPDAADSPDTQG